MTNSTNRTKNKTILNLSPVKRRMAEKTSDEILTRCFLQSTLKERKHMEKCDVIIVRKTASPSGGRKNGVTTSIIKPFILPGKMNLLFAHCLVLKRLKKHIFFSKTFFFLHNSVQLTYLSVKGAKFESINHLMYFWLSHHISLHETLS